ncbi:DNA-binding protein WhiA [Corynebacterium sp. UMB8791]
MSLTAKTKEELLRTPIGAKSAAAAEASALVRFAGELDASIHGVTMIADFAEEAVARRLILILETLFMSSPKFAVVSPGSATKETKYEVRLDTGVEALYRRLNLRTQSGHLVVGMPPQIVSGEIAEVEAAWRGAFLARGALTEPGRTAALEVECPCEEAGLALVGLARRLGCHIRMRETRGVERVHVRDAETIGVLLSRMGAPLARLEWDAKLREKQAQMRGGQRLATFDDANTRRSVHAATVAAQRVERAMEILGDDVPEHLAEAGYLRVEHRQASLEELGRLADPQMTKDAVAGRIRRLLSLADKRAAELGIANTRGNDTKAT